MMLEREFSFSLSRLETFNACRRAYYFRYILSWGGWERGASTETRLAYFLKNLLDKERWLSHLFKRILRNIVAGPERALFKTSRAMAMAQIEFNRAWEDAVRNADSALPEGKNPSITQLYYGGRKTSPALKKTLWDNLASAIEALAKSQFLKDCLDTDYLELRRLASPEEFIVANIKVYHSADFMAVRRGVVEISNVYLKGFRDVSNWERASGIAAIFASGRCKTENAAPRSVFLLPDELSVWAASPPREIEEMIKAQSSAMLEFENKHGRTTPQVERSAICGGCEFRMLCP